jgi:hypothetical protein
VPALTVVDDETERLANEISEWTGEPTTGAIRTALRERRQGLILQRVSVDRHRLFRDKLERDLAEGSCGHDRPWPESGGAGPILSYGPAGKGFRSDLAAKDIAFCTSARMGGSGVSGFTHRSA